MKLDAPYGSTPEELHSNFRKLAKICHPDAGGTTKDFQELQADLHRRLNAKEKPKPKPVKIQRLMASMGHSANLRNGITTIEAYIREGYNKLEVRLYGKRIDDREFYTFLMRIPETFKDGLIGDVQGLPFPCQVILYHK